MSRVPSLILFSSLSPMCVDTVDEPGNTKKEVGKNDGKQAPAAAEKKNAAKSSTENKEENDENSKDNIAARKPGTPPKEIGEIHTGTLCFSELLPVPCLMWFSKSYCYVCADTGVAETNMSPLQNDEDTDK